MKIQYQAFNLHKKTLGLIEQANTIIDEYQAQGFELTVRQIYYQFVARGLIPNNLKSYGVIAGALQKGRMCGLIDWDAIVDRTRNIYSNTHWEDPEQILKSAAYGYKLDSRADQTCYIEVWIEKNALLGVIAPICKKLDVTYLPCIGYYSLSSMWRASERLQAKGKPCIILHLGDHDPSGLDMTRDIRDRLEIFECESLEVRRIALTMEQVKKYNPPPNPAKLSDSRAAEYVSEYGYESWELDALSPTVIADLIEKNVSQLTNKVKRQNILDLQEEQRERLFEIANDWEE